MNVQKTDKGLLLTQADCFNPKDILECGQIFRFAKNAAGDYCVFSLDKFAEIKSIPEGYFVETDAPDYFYGFFDLDRDYGAIIEKLSKSFDVMKQAADFGRGIRILRQNLEEMIFPLSFRKQQHKAHTADYRQAVRGAGRKNALRLRISVGGKACRRFGVRFLFQARGGLPRALSF